MYEVLMNIAKDFNSEYPNRSLPHIYTDIYYIEAIFKKNDHIFASLNKFNCCVKKNMSLFCRVREKSCSSEENLRMAMLF